MADRQLDLFGEAVADAPAATLPNETSEAARVPLIAPLIVRVDVDDDSMATECTGP